MIDFCKLFQAISDKHRREILLLLEERERCVSELLPMFSLSQSAVSKHLAVLKNAGLVNSMRRGQQVFYSINGENLQVCCREYFKKFHCCNSLFSRNMGEGSEKN